MSDDKKRMLLLDSLDMPDAGDPNHWGSVASITNYINNIETSKGRSGDNRDALRAMVSGIPSPWARMIFTRSAVLQDSKKLETSVLHECYKAYKSEWRGLVAAYALRPDSFKFSEPVSLTGRKVEDNGGEMSLLNLYGEMLFNEQALWTLKNLPLNPQGDNPACIQILYYDMKDESGRNTRVTVGATSPYTLLFSAVGYSLKGAEREIPWIDNEGKLCDPTPMDVNKISLDDIQRLHSFIHNICVYIKSSQTQQPDPGKYYLDYIQQLCLKNPELSYATVKDFIDSWSSELGRWEEELKKKLTENGKTVNTSIPVAVAMPQGPLAMLMNNEHTFYLDGTNLFSTAKGESPIEISSSDIFMDSEYIAAWKSTADPLRDYSKSPVYYMRTDGGEYYLALPFTKKALKVFSNAISDIMAAAGGMSLVAKVKPDGKVEVDFRARIDGSSDFMSVCKKTYKLDVIPETDGKVFTWPDFRSPQWHKYFYYSEFPANVTGVRMLPNFEGADFDSISETDLKNMYLVKYPVNRVATNMHKYEILSSKTPLHSVSVRLNKGGHDIDGGTLLVKTPPPEGTVTGSLYMKDLKSIQNLKPATVGIDFGSTNTCVYYKLDSSETSVPMPFKNRRLALVGFENPHLSLAQKDELYFISNEETVADNGQIKSWLHEHDPQYLTADGNVQSIADLKKELVGGVPVNESNIPVIMMDEYTIRTNAGILHYNMKWLDESEKRKTAFMRMLWIQICADMVEANAIPAQLNWSFPSAMSNKDRKSLSGIYKNATVYPFENTTSYPEESSDKSRPVRINYTEAESVCSYSISKNSVPDLSRLTLGIDIGGSTSDLLIMGNRDNKNVLMTQSSIRLAGGFFFKAINSSEKFRRALYNFHESHITPVKVLNISDIISKDPQVYGRAPYYLNSVFDQLHSARDFEQFYEYLHTDVPAIFALPAYVTGVLLFYAGKLAKNVITKNGMDSIREVHTRYYGKGGRLFEWLLDKYEEDALRYYRRCFNSGFGSSDVKFILDNFSSENERSMSKIENKSEVAMGLVCGQLLHIAPDRGSFVRDDEDESRLVIENFDIVGEKGLMFTKSGAENRMLDDMEVIPDEIFDGGINLSFPDKLENFNEFLAIFLKFIEVDSGGILSDIRGLERGKDNLNVLAYIQNDPEYMKYLKAKNQEQTGAAYKMPIFIAAALSYLNNTLLPIVAKQI